MNGVCRLNPRRRGGDAEGASDERDGGASSGRRDSSTPPESIISSHLPSRSGDRTLCEDIVHTFDIQLRVVALVLFVSIVDGIPLGGHS
ncbi:hypothetical protein Misp02_30870 [Microtetraspora sp. NBRC 16547]|nr:hypothetical protein Misp02_30870 [Microtetraspora sp. NBRC 16547]